MGDTRRVESASTCEPGPGWHEEGSGRVELEDTRSGPAGDALDVTRLCNLKNYMSPLLSTEITLCAVPAKCGTRGRSVPSGTYRHTGEECSSSIVDAQEKGGKHGLRR